MHRSRMSCLIQSNLSPHSNGQCTGIVAVNDRLIVIAMQWKHS